MLTFFVGLMVGGVIGVFGMCLIVAAGDADRRNKNYEDEYGSSANHTNDHAAREIIGRRSKTSKSQMKKGHDDDI